MKRLKYLHIVAQPFKVASIYEAMLKSRLRRICLWHDLALRLAGQASRYIMRKL